MRIIDILTAVLVLISITALFSFFFYPYAELASMEDKRNHAVGCLYILIGSVVGLAITAYIASRN